MPVKRIAKSALSFSILGFISATFYAVFIERNWFSLKKIELPVLPKGSKTIKILHLSDIHMLPNQRKKQTWINSLSKYQPDLIVNTGDNLSSAKSIPFVLRSLENLLPTPGVFVFGSNDYFSPKFKNPLKYLQKDTSIKKTADKEVLPWKDLNAAFLEHGWNNVTHKVVTLNINGTDLIIGGVDDPHLHQDNFSLLQQQLIDVPSAKSLLRIGLTHSPEPRVLNDFSKVNTDLVFAGHTHGGQLCLPIYGALITNCGIDRKRVKGLSTWGEKMKLIISAGLGTSPYAPARFFARPEAILVTLVEKTS